MKRMTLREKKKAEREHRDRRILVLARTKTYEEIGEMFDLTRQRVGQIIEAMRAT